MRRRRRPRPPAGHKALARSEDTTSSWILIDFVDVVVHVFSQKPRLYYDLDSLWGDAQRVKWEREPGATPGTGETGSK